MAIRSLYGYTAKTLHEHRDEFEQAFRAVLGKDLSVSGDTMLGQLIMVLSRAHADADAVLVSKLEGFDVSRAGGRALENIASIFLLQRRLATFSKALVTLRGIGGTLVPRGTRLASLSGIVFVTDADAIIGANGMIEGVGVTSEIAGELNISKNEITQILDVVVGFTQVTNPDAVISGKNRETDTSLRFRIEENQGINQLGTIGALKSALLKVRDVEYVEILENRSGSNAVKRGQTLAPYSILPIVDGGLSEEIGEAIEKVSYVAQRFTGTQTRTGTNIRWIPASRIPVTVSATVRGPANFPGGALMQMVDNLFAWWNGEWSVYSGIRNLGAVRMGRLPVVEEMQVPLLLVAGAKIEDLKIIRKDTSMVVSSVEITERLTLAKSDIKLTFARET